jgi:hypothetical protein
LNVKLAVVKQLPGTLLHPICPQDAFTTGYLALLRQWILPQLREVVNTAAVRTTASYVYEQSRGAMGA